MSDRSVLYQPRRPGLPEEPNLSDRAVAGRPCAGPGSHLALPHGQLMGCFARGDHFIAKCIVDVVLSSRRGELLHQSGGEFGELKHGSGCMASAAVGDRSALEIALGDLA
jgi:hypothetical protein